MIANAHPTPSTFSSCGSSCPVENLNWHKAAAYCNALYDMAGNAYPGFRCVRTLK